MPIIRLIQHQQCRCLGPGKLTGGLLHRGTGFEHDRRMGDELAHTGKQYVVGFGVLLRCRLQPWPLQLDKVGEMLINIA